VTQTGKARQMEAAIQSLLTCRTIVEAAEQCQVSRRTLHRWMKHERFKRQYDAAKKGLLNGAINRLRMAGFDAGERLHEVIKDKDAPVSSAVFASGKVYDLLLKATEIEDLSERLDKLERSLQK